MKLTIPSYNSYKYKELYEITAWRDGCIWKTRSLGFIQSTDYTHPEIDTKKYGLSSISTNMTAGQYTHLDPFIEDLSELS